MTEMLGVELQPPVQQLIMEVNGEPYHPNLPLLIYEYIASQNMTRAAVGQHMLTLQIELKIASGTIT